MKSRRPSETIGNHRRPSEIVGNPRKSSRIQKDPGKNKKNIFFAACRVGFLTSWPGWLAGASSQPGWLGRPGQPARPAGWRARQATRLTGWPGPASCWPARPRQRSSLAPDWPWDVKRDSHNHRNSSMACCQGFYVFVSGLRQVPRNHQFSFFSYHLAEHLLDE